MSPANLTKAGHTRRDSEEAEGIVSRICPILFPWKHVQKVRSRVKRFSPVWTAGLALIAAGAVWSDLEVERVADDAASKAAATVREIVSRTFPDAAIKITASAEKAVAYKCEGLAMLLVPDHGFTAKSIDDAADKAAPAGWIVLRGVVPVVDGQRIASSRLATARPEGSERDVTILFLAVRKDGDKRLLDVYSRDAKPFCQLPLTRKEKRATRPLEATFTNVDRDAKQVDCVAALDGAYEATLRLGAAE